MLKILLSAALLVGVTGQALADSHSLKQQLDERKAEFSKNAPQELKDVFDQGVIDVAESGVLKTALNTGDKAPDFILPNAKGEDVRLYDLLENGSVVLTWYRGGWCPYCNITLSALQKHIPAFEKHNAQLVAISPEKPDKAFSTRQKNALNYHVLSDTAFKASDAYGLTYEVPTAVLDKFKGRIDLTEYNAEEHTTKLPLTVTYVINPEGTITYAFVDPDYRKRAEPSDILKALEKEQ